MLVVKNLNCFGLAPVSFELDDGECLTISGRSGSGKTLLLRAIADLDPNEGTASLDGMSREEMHAPIWRRLVTYIPTIPGWWAETVGAHFDEWPTAVPLVIELGLPENCNVWPVERLSTGERQKLGVIRALLLNPRVLLLDEPTSGLDMEASNAVERLVMSLITKGTSCLWVSHDDRQIRRISRRSLVIEESGVREVVL